MNRVLPLMSLILGLTSLGMIPPLLLALATNEPAAPFAAPLMLGAALILGPGRGRRPRTPAGGPGAPRTPLIWALMGGRCPPIKAQIRGAWGALGPPVGGAGGNAPRPRPRISPALSPREGYLVVTLTWVGVSLLGAMPYMFWGGGINFTDAFFESACAFATTGGTALLDIEALPGSLLLWRAISHWAGGMGIVMLSVALMPLFGVGGFQLVKAETPGPEKEKLTPRVTAMAKNIWLVYACLTAALIGLYRIGGMGWFDALCHGLTTMATGGVSTKNGGLGSYGSAFIEGAATGFMLLSALNFSLYYRALQGKWGEVFSSTELKAYLGIFAAACAVVTVTVRPLYGGWGEALRYGAYQTASMLSTTGSRTADYTLWPPLAQGTLFILMLCGGCSGSTAGGIKVIRCAILFRQAGNETRRLLAPQGVFAIRLNRKVGRRDVIYGCAAFLFLYLCVIGAVTIAAAFSGMDLFSSFSAAVSILGNVGAAFGAAGAGGDYSAFAPGIKWLFALTMIAGRLELWTVLVLASPAYWRAW